MKNHIEFDEIKKILSGDSYVSGENCNIKDQDAPLPFFQAFSFYARFVKIILDARSLAVKGKYPNERLVESSFDIIRSVEKSGGRFVIKGLDNLRKDEGPLVIVSNHMSTLETGLFPSIVGINRSSTFVVKKSLVTNPVFGPVMRSLDPIDVERKEPRKDLDTVLSRGCELLSAGRSVILFPQATRTPVFEPDKFNSLGIKLAKRAGVRILPAALKTDFWENGKTFSTFGYLYPGRTIHVEFGPSMAIDGAGKKEHEEIVAFIKSRFDNWK